MSENPFMAQSMKKLHFLPYRPIEYENIHSLEDIEPGYGTTAQLEQTTSIEFSAIPGSCLCSFIL